MSVFSNEESWASNHRVASVRQLVKQLRRDSSDPRMKRMSEDWVNSILDSLPANYLSRVPPTDLLELLVTMRRLEKEDVIIRGRHDRENDLTEYSVMTREEYGRGCFSKICGVLTAKRLEILSAQIITCDNGTVLDTFQVIDGDYTGTVPAIRMAEIAEAARDVLLGRQTVEKMLMTNRRYVSDAVPILVQETPQVVTDNESSDSCTVIDVFAHDRRGLLFIIATVLRELSLNVTLAKISTHLDQVVDVFYVTDAAGEKIRDEAHLSLIRNLLTERISRFLSGSEL
jgi:[protein-PII] uridylyltransferase